MSGSWEECRLFALVVYLLLVCDCSPKKEESQQKKLQEASTQKAHLRIEELERAKQQLEQEVQANRRRLELERLAAQQVTPGLALPGLGGASRGGRGEARLDGGEARLVGEKLGWTGEKPGWWGRSRGGRGRSRGGQWRSRGGQWRSGAVGEKPGLSSQHHSQGQGHSGSLCRREHAGS